MKKFFERHILRKLPDGRPALGFGAIAACILLPFIAFIIYMKWPGDASRPQSTGVKTPTVSVPISRGELAEESQKESLVNSERRMAKDPIPSKPSASSTLPAVEPPNALDLAVSEAEKEVQKERPKRREETAMPGMDEELGGAESPDSSNPLRNGIGGMNMGGSGSSGGSGDERLNSVNITQLISYRRPSQPPASAPTTPAAVPPRPTVFIPRGEYIEVYLLDTIQTDQPQPIVTFGVAKDVVYKGKVLIPFGTKILASVAGSPSQGQRVTVSLSSLQWLEDGTETGLSGVVKGMDNATGLPAYYIPPPLWSQMSSYVNDFLAGYLNLLYAKQQNQMQLSVGGVTLGNAQQSTFDPRLESLAVTSNVIQTFAKKQMDELQARYAPYLVVPPGTIARIQLTSPLDLSKRGVGAAGDMPASIAGPAPAQGATSTGMPDLNALTKLLGGAGVNSPATK